MKMKVNPRKLLLTAGLWTTGNHINRHGNHCIQPYLVLYMFTVIFWKIWLYKTGSVVIMYIKETPGAQCGWKVNINPVRARKCIHINLK